jgi:ribosomal protein S18 acetylase RimI-like enzyme
MTRVHFATIPIDVRGASYRIRSVEESDLPALEWDGEYTHFRLLFRQAYTDMLAGGRLLLALEDLVREEIVGQIFIQFSSSDARFADGHGRGYLYALRIKPHYRRQGLGTRLIRAAEDALCLMGMRVVSIGVAKDNLPARSLYERLGYRVLADLPGEWTYVDHLGKLQKVVEPAWLMEKRLTP